MTPQSPGRSCRPDYEGGLMAFATVVTLLEALAPAMLLVVVIGGAMAGTLWLERWDEQHQPSEHEKDQDQDR